MSPSYKNTDELVTLRKLTYINVHDDPLEGDRQFELRGGYFVGRLIGFTPVEKAMSECFSLPDVPITPVN